MTLIRAAESPRSEMAAVGLLNQRYLGVCQIERLADPQVAPVDFLLLAIFLAESVCFYPSGVEQR